MVFSIFIYSSRLSLMYGSFLFLMRRRKLPVKSLNLDPLNSTIKGLLFKNLVDWHLIDEIPDIDSAVSAWFTLFTDAIDHHTPVKKQ